jgi:hypothetical protein
MMLARRGRSHGYISRTAYRALHIDRAKYEVRDMHFARSNSYDLPYSYGFMNQFVPQLELGEALCGSTGPPGKGEQGYQTGPCAIPNPLRHWVIQSQYFVSALPPPTHPLTSPPYQPLLPAPPPNPPSRKVCILLMLPLLLFAPHLPPPSQFGVNNHSGVPDPYGGGWTGYAVTGETIPVCY